MAKARASSERSARKAMTAAWAPGEASLRSRELASDIVAAPAQVSTCSLVMEEGVTWVAP